MRQNDSGWAFEMQMGTGITFADYALELIWSNAGPARKTGTDFQVQIGLYLSSFRRATKLVMNPVNKQ